MSPLPAFMPVDFFQGAPLSMQLQAPAEAAYAAGIAGASRHISPCSILQGAGGATSSANERCNRARERSSSEDKKGTGIEDALRELVARCVDRSSLWGDTEGWERRMRRRCFRDRLCRQAQDKYQPLVISYSSGSWPNFLRTPKWHARISQWVLKKVSEAASQRAGRH